MPGKDDNRSCYPTQLSWKRTNYAYGPHTGRDKHALHPSVTCETQNTECGKGGFATLRQDARRTTEVSLPCRCQVCWCSGKANEATVLSDESTIPTLGSRARPEPVEAEGFLDAPTRAAPKLARLLQVSDPGYPLSRPARSRGS